MSAIKEAFEKRVPESAIEVIGKLQHDAAKAHFAAGFKAGLERAAKVCDGVHPMASSNPSMLCSRIIRQLAKEE